MLRIYIQQSLVGGLDIYIYINTNMSKSINYIWEGIRDGGSTTNHKKVMGTALPVEHDRQAHSAAWVPRSAQRLEVIQRAGSRLPSFGTSKKSIGNLQILVQINLAWLRQKHQLRASQVAPLAVLRVQLRTGLDVDFRVPSAELLPAAPGQGQCTRGAGYTK